MVNLSEAEQEQAKKFREEQIAKESIFSDQVKKFEQDRLRKMQMDKYYKDDIFKPNLLADDILKSYKIVTTTDTQDILLYNEKDGLYHANGTESMLMEDCKRRYEEITIHQLREVMMHIKASTFIHRREINKEATKMHLKNGIFDLRKMEVGKHDPAIISTISLPIAYNIDADCPKFKEFLTQILLPEDIPIIQEMFGYCFWKDYFLQKAFMLLGGGANGKSTLLGVLSALLGNDNISNISLHDIIEYPFALSNLYCKLANIHTEVSDRVLSRTGHFKMLTGKDFVFANVKFKEGFTFINYAKLIFACNKLPETKEDTDAFFRRWIIIQFPYKFNKEKADKTLIDKLTTEEELSGIFNWAMEGLKRILANQDFSYSKSTDNIAEKYIRLSDSLRAFVMDWVKEDREGYVTKADFYEKYLDYCDEVGVAPKPKNTVGSNLPQIVKTREGKALDGKERVWRGIVIKEVPLDAQETLETEVFQEESIENEGIIVHMVNKRNDDKRDTKDYEKQLLSVRYGESILNNRIFVSLLSLIKLYAPFSYFDLEQTYTQEYIKETGKEPSEEDLSELYVWFENAKKTGKFYEPRPEQYQLVNKV